MILWAVPFILPSFLCLCCFCPDLLHGYFSRVAFLPVGGREVIGFLRTLVNIIKKCFPTLPAHICTEHVFFGVTPYSKGTTDLLATMKKWGQHQDRVGLWTWTRG